MQISFDVVSIVRLSEALIVSNHNPTKILKIHNNRQLHYCCKAILAYRCLDLVLVLVLVLVLMLVLVLVLAILLEGVDPK